MVQQDYGAEAPLSIRQARPGSGGTFRLLTPIAWKRPPMPFGAIRRATSPSIAAARAGLAAMRREARSAMPRRAEELRLRDRPVAREAPLCHGRGEGCEIDLRRQVRLARRRKRILVAMGAHRLQRIAQPRHGVAVVDEQRGERAPERSELDAPGRERRRARLAHAALGRGCVQPAAGARRRSGSPSTNDELPGSLDPDRAAAPAAAATDTCSTGNDRGTRWRRRSCGRRRRAQRGRRSSAARRRAVSSVAAVAIARESRCSRPARRSSGVDERRARCAPRAARRASGCRARAQLDQAQRAPARPSAARRPRTTARSARRTPG